MTDNNFDALPPENDMTPEEAKASVLEFINQMANLKARADQHKPILKSIEELGVPVYNRDVEIDGELKKCVVIPVADLLVKEYESMTGFNASGYMSNVKTVKRVPEEFHGIKIESE